MGKPLDDRVKKILKELGLDPKQCLWDCHGTWVMYHRYIEQAGAKNKIEYDLTEIETNSAAGVVCIKCTASIGINGGKAKCITYGEASPKNTKNSYPYAMAEKRAKDRVVLKLVDLSGNFYSEDEADDFKDAKPQGEVYEPEMIDFLKEAFTQFMVVQHTKEEVQSFYKNNSKILGNLQANHNSVYEEIKTVFKDRIKEIQNLAKGDKNG